MTAIDCTCNMATIVIAPTQSKHNPYTFDAPAYVICRVCARNWGVVVTTIPHYPLPATYKVRLVYCGFDVKHRIHLDRMAALWGNSCVHVPLSPKRIKTWSRYVLVSQATLREQEVNEQV